MLLKSVQSDAVIVEERVVSEVFNVLAYGRDVLLDL
jgi:hypothetical protein